MARMTFITSNVVLSISNLIIPVALLVFASGFFPYKPFLPGLAKHAEFEPPPAPFDKIIFMVVDALRRYSARCLILECQELR